MQPFGPAPGTHLGQLRALLAIILAPLLLAACATGPSYSEMGSAIPPVAPNLGRVYVYRPAAYVAAGAKPEITVNGRTVGRSANGGFFYVDLPPGNYDFVALGGTGNGDGRTYFTLRAGDEVYVRISFGFVSFRAEVANPAIAQANMAGLKYGGASQSAELIGSEGKIPGSREGGEAPKAAKAPLAQPEQTVRADQGAYADNAAQSEKIPKTNAAQQKVARPSGGEARQAPQAPGQSEAAQRSTASELTKRGGGLYSLDSAIDFNVLDDVVFNPGTGQITLIGHRDPAFGTEAIPYLEHLAELLDNPTPSFSLNWTPESQPRVNALFQSFSSPEYVKGLVRQWSEVMGPDGHPTGPGRWVLPYLGIKPTINGQRLGRLGTSVQENQNKLMIISVDPGSPADLAGLRPGDAVYNYANADEYTHMIRLLGEGGHLMLQIEHYGVVGAPLTITLGGAQGDPWAELDKYDLIARMLAAVGNNEASNLVNAFGTLQRILSGTQAGGQNATYILILAAGYYQSYLRDISEFQAGRLSNDEVLDRTFHAILAAMERAFEIEDGAGTRAYDYARQNGVTPQGAYDQAVPVMNARMEPYLVRVTGELLARNDEIVVPADEMARTVGPQVEVAPEYRGLNPHSSVAHVLYSADYLGKTLINMPSLQQRIPRYESEFEFERNHPEAAGQWKDTGQYHLWLSIGGLDLVESQDGNTLHTRGATIRINIREEGQGGSDVPPVAGGYEELLNSLYGDLSREFPVFHELGEAAKVAGSAMWLKEKRPELRMPGSGRASWSVPGRVPGALFMTFSPKERPGRLAAALSAMGGAELDARKVLAEFQRDRSTPDLRRDPTVTAPEGADPALISSVLKLPDGLSLPQPVGWVKKGTVDGQAETAVTIAPETDLRDASAPVQAQHNDDEGALVLWKSGDLDGAIASLNGRLRNETDPHTRADLMTMLAQILHEKGDDAEAIRTIDEARAINPANPKILILIGMLRSEMGDSKGAVEALQKYVALEPGNKAAATLLAKLEGPGQGDASGAAPAQASQGQLAPFAGPLAYAAGEIGGPAEAMKAGSELQDIHIGQYQAHGLPPPTSVPAALVETWKEYQAKRNALREEYQRLDSALSDIEAKKDRHEGDADGLAKEEADLKAQQADVTKQVEAADKKMSSDIVKWDEEHPDEAKASPSQGDTPPRNDSQSSGSQPHP